MRAVEAARIYPQQSVTIISIANHKGGDGKTTTTTHLGAGLATLGWRVGIVDTDSQGHAGLIFRMPELNCLYDVMVGKSPLSEGKTVFPIDPARYSTVEHPATGALYVLPTGDQTYKIGYELKPHEGFLFLEA